MSTLGVQNGTQKKKRSWLTKRDGQGSFLEEWGKRKHENNVLSAKSDTQSTLPICIFQLNLDEIPGCIKHNRADLLLSLRQKCVVNAPESAAFWHILLCDLHTLCDQSEKGVCLSRRRAWLHWKGMKL